ncbi:MAG: DUF3231 family protein [Firmicutes bacterium]|nr:DUF3231 family protein [Bacillota bacterium]
MIDIMDKIQRITDIGKARYEKRKNINISEVFYIWDVLVVKHDILETVNIVRNFIEDIDLKFIVGKMEKALVTGIEDMEKLMNDYGIPYPPRPPADNKTTIKLEHFTDRYIYESIHEAIQAFFPILSSGFMNSTAPKVRKAFKDRLILTMELQDLIIEYGKLKGFLDEPPDYIA